MFLAEACEDKLVSSGRHEPDRLESVQSRRHASAGVPQKSQVLSLGARSDWLTAIDRDAALPRTDSPASKQPNSLAACTFHCSIKCRVKLHLTRPQIRRNRKNFGMLCCPAMMGAPFEAALVLSRLHSFLLRVFAQMPLSYRLPRRSEV